MTGISRRTFLTGSAATAAGLTLAGPFEGFVAHAASGKGRGSGGYGPLSPVPDLRDGAVRLDLPEGFSYRSFHPTGSTIGDGATLPGRHDGMAAFKGRNGNTIIVRNHEILGPSSPIGGSAALYDPLTGGGTVTVEVDGHGNVIDDWVSLQGTQNNCAGGPTPWGSWLTCEETVNGDDVGRDFTGRPNTGQLQHGYMFEVPTNGSSDAVPIRAAGRFAHEAAAVPADGHHVYMTEDNFGFPSGFYRYTPPMSGRRAGRIMDGGTLEMLKVVGVDNADLSLGQAPGATYAVEWVTIDDPDPTMPPGTTNDEAIVMVGDQGRAKGAAIFSRLEGAYATRDLIYFVSTQGGAQVDSDPSGFGAGRGQVWAYEDGPKRLHLVYESPGVDTLDLPDNVAASTRGTLVLCEDGRGDNFLRGLTRKGEVFNFARNADPDQAGQEFAGATFSHDGSTLFANIQSSSGYSIAIWGPWNNGPF
ncbi:MAG: DUF839 domain-containing protein [Ilumatobacter sp.]|nr:DUF839 domain-containing protein [Ilumatobacter sp.]